MRAHQRILATSSVLRRQVGYRLFVGCPHQKFCFGVMRTKHRAGLQAAGELRMLWRRLCLAAVAHRPQVYIVHMCNEHVTVPCSYWACHTAAATFVQRCRSHLRAVSVKRWLSSALLVSVPGMQKRRPGLGWRGVAIFARKLPCMQAMQTWLSTQNYDCA